MLNAALFFPPVLLAIVAALSLACAVRQPPSQDYATIERRSPPEQPEKGPGGKDYKHAKVIHISKDENADGFALFLPDDPVPESADVVVFLHGLAQVNPKMYGGWIEHLVRKGNIVIWPRYEKGLTPKNEFEPNAVAGIKSGLAELKARCDASSACVQPRLDHFAVLGHSYGGALAANITVHAPANGLPKVQALMVNQGWYGSDIGLPEGYGAMPADTKLLLLVGSKDIVVGSHFAGRLWRDAKIQPPFKNLVTHHADPYNLFAPINSGHDEPLSLQEAYNNNTLTTLIAIALPLTRTNAVDYYCYWKLSEALLNCAFENQNCGAAFGNTPEQRFMGTWGDGRPVRELQVKTP
jgi:dienelactone hydrolase